MRQAKPKRASVLWGLWARLRGVGAFWADWWRHDDAERWLSSQTADVARYRHDGGRREAESHGRGGR